VLGWNTDASTAKTFFSNPWYRHRTIPRVKPVPKVAAPDVMPTYHLRGCLEFKQINATYISISNNAVQTNLRYPLQQLSFRFSHSLPSTQRSATSSERCMSRIRSPSLDPKKTSPPLNEKLAPELWLPRLIKASEPRYRGWCWNSVFRVLWGGIWQRLRHHTITRMVADAAKDLVGHVSLQIIVNVLGRALLCGLECLGHWLKEEGVKIAIECCFG